MSPHLGLQRLLAFLDDWLFPEKVSCLCCHAALMEEDTDQLCAACRQALYRLEWTHTAVQPPEGLTHLYVAFLYDAQVRTLIHALKYRSVRACAVPLCEAMSTLPTQDEELLVPIPTTKRRMRQRGFNQAALLSEMLAKRWGMPMCEALVRTDDRAAQSTLNGKQRQTNLTGCMATCADVSGLRILLVDDVVTTGSTAREAARALLEAGAKSVSILAAAHTAPAQLPFDLPNIKTRTFRSSNQ